MQDVIDRNFDLKLLLKGYSIEVSNKHFDVLQHRSGFYRVFTRDGSVCGRKSVRGYKINRAAPEFIQILDLDNKWSLYNQIGDVMPGADKVDFLKVNDDKSYYVKNKGSRLQKYHSKESRQKRNNFVKFIIAMCAAGALTAGITKCAQDKKHSAPVDTRANAAFVMPGNAGRV